MYHCRCLLPGLQFTNDLEKGKKKMKKSLSNQRVVDVGTKKNIGITRGSSTGLWDQHTRTSQVTGNVPYPVSQTKLLPV